VVGYINLGTDDSPVEFFRTPSVAFVRGFDGPNAGQFVMINAGRQTQNLGIWPTEYAFSPTDLATGGGIAEILQPSTLFETTPQGRLTTPKLQNGEVGWKPRQESADKTDAFFNEVDINVVFKFNPQLRGGIGTSTLYPDEKNMRTPDRYGIVNSFVDPDNPRTMIVEYNIFKPEIKLDPATRASIEDQAAGSIGLNLSKVIYGKDIDNITQEQANYIGLLTVRLRYEIRPLGLIAPTTG